MTRCRCNPGPTQQPAQQPPHAVGKPVRHACEVTLLLPFVLVGPVMMLVVAVLALAAHGPLGWLAAGALLLAVAWTCREVVRRTCSLWATTKAPELTADSRHPWAHHPHGRHARAEARAAQACAAQARAAQVRQSEQRAR